MTTPPAHALRFLSSVMCCLSSAFSRVLAGTDAGYYNRANRPCQLALVVLDVLTGQRPLCLVQYSPQHGKRLALVRLQAPKVPRTGHKGDRRWTSTPGEPGMSVDKQIADAGFQTPAPSAPPPTRGWRWRWLSTGLIVAGVLLLGAGGVMAYLSLAVPAEPPPPVGLVEPTFPPSLEDNPLPVITGDELTAEAMSAASPTPTLGLTPTPLPATSQPGS